MMKTSIFAISTLASLLMGFNAQAVTINIDGNVIAFPCEVDASSVTQTVDLGKVTATGLINAGSAYAWKSFNVKVINCPASVETLTAKFSGTPAGAAGNLYANTGSAQNVAVQVAQRANMQIIQGNGSTMKVNVDSNSHEAVFPLVGRMYSEQGNATSGTLISAMELDFSYP